MYHSAEIGYTRCISSVPQGTQTVPPVQSPSHHYRISWRLPGQGRLVYVFTPGAGWSPENTPKKEPIPLAEVLTKWARQARTSGSWLEADGPAGCDMAQAQSRGSFKRVSIHAPLSARQYPYILEVHRMELRAGRHESVHVRLSERKCLASVEKSLADALILPKEPPEAAVGL